ncbi:MAG: S41 family peptidase [FCB group bacterium]|jgi:hypothetical protein|nr:S41 family peptidase [FCB group bacterium]
MRASRKLFFALVFVFPFFSNGCPPPQPSETQQLFDQVWSTFDQNYSYFEAKDIDWDDVRDDYRPLFSQDLSAAVFAERIAEMQQELHDWHVWVRKPTGEYLGYEGDYDINYPFTLYGRYTTQGYSTIGDDVIFHAWVGDDDDIAYIVVDTLDSTAWQSVSDAAIGNLFVTYQDAEGMILDIRANSGGNENNAIKIASRFTHSSVIYGYTETRNGPDHGDFDPLVTKTLASSAGMHFDGPVVCLIGQRCMSSAEWFALMMRACPNVTLMGDWTRGASGNPQTYSLSNGVTYAVSRWAAYTDTLDVIEDNGIEPDEYLPAVLSYDDTRDYLLEDAIDFLQIL